MTNENYIMLNGQKIEITVSEERLRELGLIPEKKSPFERAELNKKFWMITETGTIFYNCDTYSGYIDELFDSANYCTDKDIMMQRALHEKLNRLLWRFSMENSADKIDWENGKFDKWYIYYRKDSSSLKVSDVCYHQSEGSVYFYTEEIAQRAIYEIIIPFMKDHPDFIW